MQKAKHAFKRPPLRHILKELLWTRFRFLHGVVQSIPQGVALEAERFLLFSPHHISNVQGVYSIRLNDRRHCQFFKDADELLEFILAEVRKHFI
ncbi:hypothetical protein DES34_103149 [Brevibacillus brevis]|nr:hypothetical protein C7J99_19540 [Brevibacillus brevis]RED32837.1 hypothetical protein DES34_103149 [Brevibacillus brevis]VEF90510.1 Uncharacterised protein [Brevibacillus brevis]